jgi:glycosyltransferase involved in cell wall biosynthesis
LRRIASDPAINLKVAFRHLGGAHVQFDEGFGRNIVWDVPLLEGYDCTIADDGAKLATLIEWSNVVWLHGWQGPWMRRALRMAARWKRPVLMRAENNDNAMPDGIGPRGWLKRLYLRRIFALCAAFLYIGEQNRCYYLKRGVTKDRLFSMSYSVDNDFFRTHAEQEIPNRSTLRNELGLVSGRPVILFAGKFSKRKNPDLLLEAFLSLDRTKTRKPYLLFVGDGELRQRLVSVAAGNPSVKFTGFRNQTALPAIYGLADIFVLASHREPWGLAVNEAMNASCSVIVSDECGCAVDLIDPDCGRVIPAGSQIHLAEAITELLTKPETSAKMGLAAKRRISRWDFDSNVNGLKTAIAAIYPSTDQS